jgi:hypothetical protein
MGMWIRTGLIALAGLLVTVATAGAVDNRIVNINQFTQNDLRAMAMGNAFGPIARGEGALFYNPAGLAQFDLDLKAEYSIGLAGTEKFALDTYGTLGSNPSNQELLDYLERYAGTTQRFNLQTLSSAVANLGYTNLGVGWGGLDAYRYSLKFDDAGTAGNILDDSLVVSEARLRLQTGAVAFKLGKGKVLLGVAAKSFKYSEKAQVLPYPTIIASGKLEFDPVGEAYPTATAYDLGMLYRAEFWPTLKPQLSVTGYNVGGVELKGKAETVEVPASYNIGFSFGPDTGIVHWLVSVEVEDVSDALKVTDFGGSPLGCKDPLRTLTCVNQPRSLTQRTHLGGEVGLWRTPTGNNIISLRAGSNRGYATYGAELNLWILRLLYAKGADNLGWKDNPDKFEFTGYQAGFAVAW